MRYLHLLSPSAYTDALTAVQTYWQTTSPKLGEVETVANKAITCKPETCVHLPQTKLELPLKPRVLILAQDLALWEQALRQIPGLVWVTKPHQQGHVLLRKPKNTLDLLGHEFDLVVFWELEGQPAEDLLRVAPALAVGGSLYLISPLASQITPPECQIQSKQLQAQHCQSKLATSHLIPASAYSYSDFRRRVFSFYLKWQAQEDQTLFANLAGTKASLVTSTDSKHESLLRQASLIWEQKLNAELKSQLKPGQRKLICLLGERGTGKTTSLRKFIQAQNPNFNICVVSNHKPAWAQNYLAPDVAIKESPESVAEKFAFEPGLETLVCIDEAATIPLGILQAIVAKYKHALLVTTLDAYEGGAGLGLLFKWLENQLSQQAEQEKDKTPNHPLKAAKLADGKTHQVVLYLANYQWRTQGEDSLSQLTRLLTGSLPITELLRARGIKINHSFISEAKLAQFGKQPDLISAFKQNYWQTKTSLQTSKNQLGPTSDSANCAQTNPQQQFVLLKDKLELDGPVLCPYWQAQPEQFAPNQKILLVSTKQITGTPAQIDSLVRALQDLFAATHYRYHANDIPVSLEPTSNFVLALVQDRATVRKDACGEISPAKPTAPCYYLLGAIHNLEEVLQPDLIPEILAGRRLPPQALWLQQVLLNFGRTLDRGQRISRISLLPAYRKLKHLPIAQALLESGFAGDLVSYSQADGLDRFWEKHGYGYVMASHTVQKNTGAKTIYRFRAKSGAETRETQLASSEALAAHIAALNRLSWEKTHNRYPNLDFYLYELIQACKQGLESTSEHSYQEHSYQQASGLEVQIKLPVDLITAGIADKLGHWHTGRFWCFALTKWLVWMQANPACVAKLDSSRLTRFRQLSAQADALVADWESTTGIKWKQVLSSGAFHTSLEAQGQTCCSSFPSMTLLLKGYPDLFQALLMPSPCHLYPT